MANRDSRIRFREIKDFPGYYAGTDGSIWTSWVPDYRKGKGIGSCGARFKPYGKWRKLKQNVRRDSGYCSVGLRRGFRSISCMVHRLVLQTFGGKKPDNTEVAHNDSNPRNNELSNLRWATKKENQADRVGNGTAPVGEGHGEAKLNDEAVRLIREVYGKGWTMTRLARCFSVDRRTVNRVLTGERWSHVS